MKTKYVVGDKVIVMHSDYEDFTIGKEYKVEEVWDEGVELRGDLDDICLYFYHHEVKPAPKSTEQCHLWSDSRTLDSILDNLNYRRNETVNIVVNLWADILCLKEEVLELKRLHEG